MFIRVLLELPDALLRTVVQECAHIKNALNLVDGQSPYQRLLGAKGCSHITLLLSEVFPAKLAALSEVHTLLIRSLCTSLSALHNAALTLL